MSKCSRRNLFKLAGAGSLALILPTMTRFGEALAQEQLDPADAQAAALGYVHDTEEVDSGQSASHAVRRMDRLRDLPGQAGQQERLVQRLGPGPGLIADPSFRFAHRSR